MTFHGWKADMAGRLTWLAWLLRLAGSDSPGRLAPKSGVSRDPGLLARRVWMSRGVHTGGQTRLTIIMEKQLCDGIMRRS